MSQRVQPMWFAVVLAGGLIAGECCLAAGGMAVSQELDVEYGFVGGATTFQGNQHLGAVNEHRADVKYVVSPQVTKDLLLRFGVEWQRFSFTEPKTGALPDVLQQVSAIIGCDYQIADQWLTRLEVAPGIYGDFRPVGWHSFDAPLVLGAVYLQEADVQWFFGLRADARSQYPVLPAAGVRWKFADEWTLNLQFPHPRVEYELNDRVQLYAGAGIQAGTFVVGDHFGDDHGLPKLNHATVDYFEVQVGPGISWKVLPNVTLEIEGGYTLGRWWDFFDEHVRLHSREAPYAQVACSGRF